MKIRIKSNSVRIRLTKTEVSKLADEGYLQEETVFPDNKLIYTLQTTATATALSATLINNKLTMFVPLSFAANWPQNEIVGINADMPVNENEKLYLLLEKDFVCLDETTEDQSDNYENPQKTC